MSRSAVIGFIVGVVLLGAIAAVSFWGRSAVDNEEQKIANRVAVDAAKSTAKDVGTAAVRNEAADISDRLLAGAGKSADQGSTSKEAPVEVSKVETETKVDRAAFTITLPPGATVDPEGTYPGADHVLNANLPGHSMTSIVVVDAKDKASDYESASIASIMKRIESPTEYTPVVLDSFNVSGTKGFQGIVKGEKFAFETGYVQGKEKACVVVVEFPAEDRATVAPVLKRALESLRMKQ